MKRLVFAAALGLCVTSMTGIAHSAPSGATAPLASAKALDPASLALAHQIVTLAFPPEKRSQMFASVMEAVVKQSRTAVDTKGLTGDKDFQKLVDRQTERMYASVMVTVDAALPDYFESMTRAYAREFSVDDLNAILVFVKTPAGQHYFERAPLILQDPDVQATSQRMMAQVLKKMPEMTREMMRDVQDYVAKKNTGKTDDRAPVS